MFLLAHLSKGMLVCFVITTTRKDINFLLEQNVIEYTRSLITIGVDREKLLNAIENVTLVETIKESLAIV